MKNDEIYQKWIEHRIQDRPGTDLSARVMDRIHEYEDAKSRGRFAWLNGIFNPPFGLAARFAFVLGLSALGLFRVTHTLILLIP